ncbi:MAG: tail fiber domain-containing protein [Dysgonomonas sp.]|nr:tail fiber domain-containing protein [Dysgonomonas sp.]
MKQLTIFLLVFLPLFIVLPIRSQVTIGSGEVPDNTAILDLKEKTDGSSTRGLLLPRVNLKSTLDYTAIAGATSMAQLAGMMVYNLAYGGTSPNEVYSDILYYNDGYKWVELPAYYDVNNGLSSSASNTQLFQLGGTLNQPTRINSSDINTLTLHASPAGLKITGNGQGLNKILTSDADGTATWQDDINWKLTGNANATATSFLGPTSDVPLKFKSRNIPSGRLEIGSTSYGYGAYDAGGDNRTTAIGVNALASLPISGHNGNTAIGHHAMANHASGSDNTAIGSKAMENANGGFNNTAIGTSALQSTTGQNNTAIGRSAGLWVQSGGYNALIGSLAGTKITTGGFNTAVGASTLTSLETGSNNIGIGMGAGTSAVSGDNNIFIGYNAGYGYTGSNRLYIGSFHNDGTYYIVGQKNSQNNMVVTINGDIPNSSYNFYVNGSAGGVYAWAIGSDRRLKKDIKDLGYGLKQVMQLKPVSFTMKESEVKRIGFIAQEVRDIIPEVVSGKEGDMEKKEYLSVTYSEFAPVLVKAVQEQQQIIDKQQQVIEALLKRVEALEEK